MTGSDERSPIPVAMQATQVPKEDAELAAAAEGAAEFVNGADQNGSSPVSKTPRYKFSRQQQDCLEAAFLEDPATPSKGGTKLNGLCENTGLDYKRIQIWFKNKRRKKRMPPEDDDHADIQQDGDPARMSNAQQGARQPDRKIRERSIQVPDPLETRWTQTPEDMLKYSVYPPGQASRMNRDSPPAPESYMVLRAQRLEQGLPAEQLTSVRGNKSLGSGVQAASNVNVVDQVLVDELNNARPESPVTLLRAFSRGRPGHTGGGMMTTTAPQPPSSRPPNTMVTNTPQQNA